MGRGTYFRDGFHVITDQGGVVQIGSGCFFNNYCSISALEHVTIGNGSTFGEGVRIYDHDHDFRGIAESNEPPFVTSPVYIGNNVWCGSNVIILKGVTIGDDAVIAAGTIITKDVPPHTVVHDVRTLQYQSY